MSNLIKSKALEVNLAETRDIVVQISDEHLWFLSLSESYWGINNRTKDFLHEFHHPYSNRKEVIEQLITILISDFWIYQEHNDCNKVINILIGLFDKLLKEDLPEDLSKQLVYIYLDFIYKNYTVVGKYENLIIQFVDILEDNFGSKYFSYINNIGYFFKSFDKLTENKNIEQYIIVFIRKLIKKNIEFWETTSDIELWYKNNQSKMSVDYTYIVNSLGKKFFNRYLCFLENAQNWKDLSKSIFTCSDIADAFRKKIEDFNKATEQFCYIYYLMHLKGMVYYRSYLLVDLNKSIKKISNELNEAETIEAIDELFVLFSELKNTNSNFILDSVLTLGKEIINTHKINLIHYFEDKIIQFGFITPGVAYLTNDWELKVNPNHIKNIRVWLELIEHDPETMKKLLSALIINLRTGGIFIFDTDLFQKDVTKLLNSHISPIYKQIKQLTRIFPVYFNEIGAEGLLRDVTTKVDELSQRNDKLIHFLRKQIHTEGNNSHIDITLEIISFWYDLKKERLSQIVPKNVYYTVDVNGIWVKGVHSLLHKLCNDLHCTINELILYDKKDVCEALSNIKHDEDTDKKRVALMIELYQLLKEKYSFNVSNIISTLQHYHFLDYANIEKLEMSLKENNHIEALKIIYSFMIKLNQIIFDPKISEGWENIYYKRHIAFGIPSMYGEYHEAKFEALGLTFRLENIAATLINNIISKININYFTAKTFKDVFLVLNLFVEGLNLDGMSDQGFNSKLKMFQYSLTSKSFTIQQYINIFQFMEVSIKEIINKYFIRSYEPLLSIVIPQYIQEKKDDENIKKYNKTILQKSEVFYRELLSSGFLIQALDNFIGDILNNLRRMVSSLSNEEIQNIMTYDPELIYSPLYKETPELDNQVFIGSKAYYLKSLYVKRYPVPDGFVLTTEVFRRIDSIIKLSSLTNEIDDLIKLHIKELETRSGLEFGNPQNPLLLSVRSGAAISMPGAMNTFLNVGLNDAITESLSKQYNYGWTSWDCYRRLLQTWGMSYGVSRNDFDQIMIDYKKKYQVNQKIEFTPNVMRDIAFSYKSLLEKHNIYFEEDPFLQLKQAIISVFNSWNTSRAVFYRSRMQIAEEWGTAVIIQKMVFGNLHNESGSGVFFTHDTQDNVSGINLTGDFSFLSQGEDIVAGLINTLPISETQRLKYYHKSNFSLETKFPEIYKKLKEISHELIEIHGFGHQEIEFTFETPNVKDLYILQSRDMSIVKQTNIKIFDAQQEDMQKIACGIGIGNDVLNGLIVFDNEDLINLKQYYPDKKAILVRPDTVPDDIEMIFECEGLLTSKGGATSHAAVTASTLRKTCIVNCEDMLVYEKEKKCLINGIELRVFDPIAIDGNNGIVYKGNYPTKIQKL